MSRLFHILPTDLRDAYLAHFSPSVADAFSQLTDSALSTDTFSFYTSVSAVFSSAIEGDEMPLDTFIKHKRQGVPYQPDYTQKIDDLYNAYLFAQQHPLGAAHLSTAHAISTAHILQPAQQGVLRTMNMFVVAPDGNIDYVAATPDKVGAAMKQLYADLTALLRAPLPFAEVFFYAALLHLVFVKIHPFCDGNGRTARLLEKWFIAQKLGDKAWFIPSERYYYEHHDAYYRHIRKLGQEYPDLDYTQSLPFLQMLPASLFNE